MVISSTGGFCICDDNSENNENSDNMPPVKYAVLIERNNIYNRDCLEGMTYIEAGSVDMVLADLPYGTTRNKWDSVIPLDLLWTQYKRIIKPNGAIVLTAQVPFNIVLGASNLPWLRYEYIWEKEQGSGFLNAKKMPLKSHENVMVFYGALPTYNPQMEPGKPYTTKRGRKSTNYGADSIDEIVTVNPGERYPKTVLRFPRDKHVVHPTQKPVALFEHLILTYTNPGDVVLDNCIGSGTTALAAMNVKRDFIGFELDLGYCEAAQCRLSL